MEIGQSAGKSFAYVLGAYLGDGCVTRQASQNSGPGTKYYPVFRLNTIDIEFAEAVKAALADITERPVSIVTHDVSKSSKPNNGLRCGCPDLCAKLVADTESKSKIPAYVWDWPREHKLAFVAGLMDSEGYVAKKAKAISERCYYMGFKSCDVWVLDFVKLLESLNFKIGKVSVCPPYKEGYKIPTRFHIKMQSWVDNGGYFHIRRKQDRVELWAKTVPLRKQRLSPTTNMLDTQSE